MIILNEFRVISELIISEAETFIQPSSFGIANISKENPLLITILRPEIEANFRRKKNTFKFSRVLKRPLF